MFYKPVTSKEGNSETYMICLNFKGTEFLSAYLPKLVQEYGKNSVKAMFKKSDIPECFLQQIIACAKLFKNYQCEVIENNIAAYQSCRNNSEFENKKISKLVADKFLKDFPLQKLHMDLQIVGNMRLKKIKNNHWIVETPAESFNERKEKLDLKPAQRLLLFLDPLKSLEPVAKVFVFKPSDLHIDTCITLGKPYRRVSSSRFCATQIVDIYNLIFQVVDMESNLQLSLPTETAIAEYEHKLQQLYNTYKIIKFQYTEIYNNSQTILRIKTTLQTLQNGEHLILLGFLLLTQFNVGFIYLMSHMFENVEFAMDDNIGCSVIFKNFKKRELILNKVEQVYKIAENDTKNDNIILSVMSVTDIYDSELYSIIVRLNNWIVKYCVHYISKIYDKDMHQEMQE